MEYPLEALDPERFQRVCQGLLLREFPSAKFFPLGQADGGRDGWAREWRGKGRPKQVVVFQVKFARDPTQFKDLAARRKWVLEAIKDERSIIESLASDGATHYRLITNVRGSGRKTSGSIDQLDKVLATLPLPADGWWRDDLLTRLDNAWDVKWRFPELLTGEDLLRTLIEGGVGEEGARRNSAIQAFLEEERHADENVKFKEAGLENSLLELFTDLPLVGTNLRGMPGRRFGHALATVAGEAEERSGAEPSDPFRGDFEDFWSRSLAPAAEFLLHSEACDAAPSMVIEGAPGQGKSTVSQYICQVQRHRLLNRDAELALVPQQYQQGGVRLPFRIDLRDLAAWLHGRNPFGEDVAQPSAGRRSVETFLAAQVEASSGGAEFAVSDLHAVFRASSVLLAFDGLDEVADVDEREKVVTEVTAGLRRLRALALSVQTVITSRPAAFENSPGFSRDQFQYAELAPLTEAALHDYAEKWIKARGLQQRAARDVRRVITDKLEAPHMRSLAQNPMQLTILLSLVHQRGVSLPDKRTALYDNYVGLFLDREAEKTPHVAEHRDLLVELHQYLAWTLQSESETGNSQGSITDAKLRALLTDYLEREQKDVGLVDVLFKGLVERVVAIVSRVEGTYEFEVQPLREYFAGRFLYDTAHHSSAGNERSGDKTDRFDALARNFYWLNVTRFFAGCVSKGELLSLVERLEALAADDAFRYTDHPRVLSSMLLGDWVFAQHPKSMKAVVDIVLRDVATRADARGPDVIVLPVGSGQAEVAARCWELWVDDLPPDRSILVARTLQANSETATMDERWRSEASKAAENENRFTSWLERGLWTGSLPRLGKEELEGLLAQTRDGAKDPERLRLLVTANQSATYEENADLSDYAVEAILSLDATLPVGVGREPRSVLEALGALEVFTYPLRDRFRGRRGRDKLALLDDVPEHLEAAADVLRVMETEADRRGVEWQTSLGPWRPVLSKIEDTWGDQRLVIPLAVAAGGIQSAEEMGRVGEAGIFGRDSSLADRARYARMRAGGGKWWSTQLAEASSNFDRLLLTSLFFAWASPKTLAAELAGFDEYVSGCDRADLTVIMRAIARGRQMQGRDPRDLTKEQLGAFPTSGLSPKTVTILSRRYPYRLLGSPYDHWLYETYFAGKSSDELDRNALLFRAEAAISLALSDDKRWEEALSCVRAAYVSGVTPVRYLQREVRGVELPTALARTVIDEWRSYPLSLVNLAEQTCRTEAGQSIETLDSVASRQQWEWI